MTKFLGGSVFIIMDEGDITVEMINYNTSKSIDTMPLKVSGGVNKRIVEIKEPVQSIFSAFTWYDKDGVVIAWDALP